MQTQIVSDIQQRLSEYVSGDMELHVFEDWFVSVLWDLAEEPDSSERRLVGHIHNLIAEASRGDRTAKSLREELAAAVRPFAQEIPVYPKPIQLVHGRPWGETGALKPLVLSSSAVPV